MQISKKILLMIVILVLSVACMGLTVASAYSVEGECSLTKAMITRAEDGYYVVSSGSTTASEELDNIHVLLDTYKDNIRVDFDGKFDYNTDFVSASFDYGPNLRESYWELYGSHMGDNDDPGHPAEDYTFDASWFWP